MTLFWNEWLTIEINILYSRCIFYYKGYIHNSSHTSMSLQQFFQAKDESPYIKRNEWKLLLKMELKYLLLLSCSHSGTNGCYKQLKSAHGLTEWEVKSCGTFSALHKSCLEADLFLRNSAQLSGVLVQTLSPVPSPPCSSQYCEFNSQLIMATAIFKLSQYLMSTQLFYCWYCCCMFSTFQFCNKKFLKLNFSKRWTLVILPLEVVCCIFT